MKVPTLRIAVLECDTPPPQAKARYGNYTSLFTVLLEAGASKAGIPPSALSISDYDVVQRREYPDLDKVDALLLTGSKHSAFDTNSWTTALVAFVGEALAHPHVRILGICYGHQIVGRALGAPVQRNEQGWEVSASTVDLSSEGQELFGREKLTIQQMHHDIVATPPPNVRLLGSSERCAVQGMYLPQRLLTVQGHPEFDAAIMTELLTMRHAQGIFDEEMFADGMQRLGEACDGVEVAAAMVRFLLDSR